MKRECMKYSYKQPEIWGIEFTLHYHRIAIGAHNAGVIDWVKKGMDFYKAADTIQIYVYTKKDDSE